MKIFPLVLGLLYIFTTVVFSQVFGSYIESELSKQHAESNEHTEKIAKMMDSFSQYSSGARSATKDEIELVEELYSTKGNSKLSIDMKSYAFAVMVHVKDISVWSKELPTLLIGESKQLAGSAIDAVYYIYKKGTKKERLYLLKKQKLREQLNQSLEKFDDENFAAKINKIFQLMQENNYLLDEPEVSQNTLEVRNRDKEEQSPKNEKKGRDNL